MMAVVYLIHFERRYKHAGHYLGYSTNLEARLEAHRNGRGARLMEVIKKAGIPWQLARVWEDGDRTLERRLKNYGGPRLCPICQAAKRDKHLDRISQPTGRTMGNRKLLLLSRSEPGADRVPHAEPAPASREGKGADTHMGPNNREVGEIIYLDAFPYPLKATIVKVCPVVWGLHTVRREDMHVNTTANEQDIVSEEYALYMRKLHKETELQRTKEVKETIATVDNLMNEKGPYYVKVLPDHARSRSDIQTFKCATWSEAIAKIKELGATGVLPSRFYENVACLKGDGAPPAAVDYERLSRRRGNREDF